MTEKRSEREREREGGEKQSTVGKLQAKLERESKQL